MSGAEHLARFVEDFAVPFLQGQRCIIGDFLGDVGCVAVQHGMSIDAELADACTSQLEHAACWTHVVPAPFDEDAGTFLAAVHELYAACHPQAQSFYARSHLFCGSAERLVQALPDTYDAERLLTRHLMLAPAFQSTRTDVVVRWWAGRAEYFGEEPPARLLAAPGLRRVDVQRDTRFMWQIALVEGDEDTRLARVSLMHALLNKSPLTRLMFLGDDVQKQLGFSLTLPSQHHGNHASPIFALDDRRIARLVTDASLHRGVDRAGPMLALALLAAVRENSAPEILRRTVEFCVHLSLSMCLLEAEQPGASESSPLRTFLHEDVTQMNEAMRVFWAVHRAAQTLHNGHLWLPPESDFPSEAALLWRDLHRRLHHTHLARIADPLTRELARRLPPLHQGATEEWSPA